jgi:serine/threonine-protein kinase
VLPAQLGPYRIVRQLGAGGMGAVYLAQDTRDGSEVALKVPLLGDAPDAATLARFRREAEVARGIEHPNICRVLDVGQHGALPYFTMPFVEGTPLSKHVGQPGPPAAAVDLVWQLAGALAAMHLRGLMHRDLKPSNVMLRPDGSPVLMDFGLTRRISGTARMTGTGQMIGTPHYMSPEQVRGDRDIGAATDIWSLGVILYELLTGRLPFDVGDNLMALFHQIFSVPPAAPSTICAALSPELERICLKALAKEAPQRHAAMADFQASLEAWQRSQSRPGDGGGGTAAQMSVVRRGAAAAGVGGREGGEVSGLWPAGARGGADCTGCRSGAGLAGGGRGAAAGYGNAGARHPTGWAALGKEAGRRHRPGSGSAAIPRRRPLAVAPPGGRYGPARAAEGALHRGRGQGGPAGVGALPGQTGGGRDRPRRRAEDGVRADPAGDVRHGLAQR